MPRRDDHEQLPERERRAITEVCEKTLPMLRLVKKTGVVRLTTTISSSRISAGPARSASSAALQQAVAVEAKERRRVPRGCSGCAWHRHHAAYRASGRRDQAGPSGNSYSSSDAGSISML